MRDTEVIELLRKILEAMEMRQVLSARLAAYRRVEETDRQTLDRIIQERNNAQKPGTTENRGPGLYITPAPYPGASPIPIRSAFRHKDDLDTED
jgi:hypothetical protein